MKPVLAIDNDDVLFIWAKSLAEWHNTTYGTTLEYADYSTYHFHKLWNVTPKEAVRRVYEFAALGHLEHLEVMNGAHKAMKVLSQTYELHNVTARSRTLDDVTRRKLEQSFTGLISHVHFVDHDTDKHRCKSVVCEQIGAVCIIDDSPSNILACAPVVQKVLLFDAPWNKDTVLPSNGERVFSWDEIVSILLL